MKEKAFVVLCTCPDEAIARQLAHRLVDERLAACVNRVPGLVSTYAWEGAVQEDREVLLIIKTLTDALPALQQRLRELHPYEVPEVIALPIEGGSERYLSWLADSVRRPGRN